jgi:prepilin-type processing-associated H-X9-DG protein
MQSYHLEWATNRLLWRYIRSRDLYRCPADKGLSLSSSSIGLVKNNCDTFGMSYWYDPSVLYGDVPHTLYPMKDPKFGNAGKREDWVRDPSRYILICEQPALPDPPEATTSGGKWLYFFWHFARGPSTVSDLSQVQDRSISPILFADGHAAKCDFTQAIRLHPNFPMEPWLDWYWYEPAP